jgi:thioredoxin reductase
MSVGISWFTNTPEEVEGLPPELLSHAYLNGDLTRFSGRKLLILGAGSSAVDTAVLAGEQGADVTLLARANIIRYHTMPDPDAESWLRSITHPASGIGTGWRSFMCENAPLLFRSMPESFRLRATKRHLGPAPGWFMRGKLKAKTLLGYTLESAREYKGGVLVKAHSPEGVAQIAADHVVAATGYRPDMRRLPFLDGALREQIAHVVHTPKLSANFETSVPGLYVQGALSANAFGPLMRFMVGAEYAAPRLAAHLLKAAAKKRAAA